MIGEECAAMVLEDARDLITKILRVLCCPGVLNSR
jgi:hypothetical protein